MLDFFGLKQKPFSKTPDPRYIYLGKEHKEALARMQYGTEEKEIIVITGEIGCGKTTLSRKLLDLIDESYVPCVVINPRGTPANFLRSIVKGFSGKEPRHYKKDLMEQIYEILFNFYQSDKTPVLIIDEAQLISSKEVFEEIRLITNFQMDDENLISIILLGQPELKTKMKRGNWEAFKQRVGFFYHLGPLNQEETANYLAHRFKVAGGQYNPFSKEAMQKLHSYSRGIPRVINHIAQNALLIAFQKENKYIDIQIIDDAAKEYESWN
jgi:type II secretory pathway predicted ATPase ExeA